MRTVFSLASVVVRSTTPLTATVDDEVVMLDPNQGVYIGLNPVGSRIWELIEQPRPVAALCRTLTDEYEVTDETCQAEVLAFLDRLRLARLVELNP